MRCFGIGITTLAAILAGCYLSLDAAEPDTSEVAVLRLHHSADSYDCLAHEGAIHIVTCNYEDGFISHYRLHDGIPEYVNEVAGIQRSRSPIERPLLKFARDLSVVIRQFDRYSRFDLRTGEEVTILEFDAPLSEKEPQFKLPVAFFSSDTIDFLIYEEENAYKRWVIGIDNIPRKYNKNYLVEIRGRQVMGSSMVQEGRTHNRDFHAVLLEDTLYAVWQERRKRSFPWIDLVPTGYVSRTVVSAYDGTGWAEPSEVMINDDPENTIMAPLGIYRLKAGWVVIWRFLCDARAGYENGLYYRCSTDRRTWGALRLLDKSIDLLSSDVSVDGELHAIVRYAGDRNKKYHCVFDGDTFTNVGAVLNEQSDAERILIDAEQSIRLFWISEDDGYAKLCYKRVGIAD